MTIPRLALVLGVVCMNINAEAQSRRTSASLNLYEVIRLAMDESPASLRAATIKENRY